MQTGQWLRQQHQQPLIQSVSQSVKSAQSHAISRKINTRERRKDTLEKKQLQVPHPQNAK